jgi:hypothetical protein
MIKDQTVKKQLAYLNDMREKMLKDPDTRASKVMTEHHVGCGSWSVAKEIGLFVSKNGSFVPVVGTNPFTYEQAYKAVKFSNDKAHKKEPKIPDVSSPPQLSNYTIADLINELKLRGCEGIVVMKKEIEF